MTVTNWDAPVRTRLFRVVYRPNMDNFASNQDIPLGILGDLRMGERYALGLIARSLLTDPEKEKLGVIARTLIAAPFTFLREQYERVWESEDRCDTFESIVSEPYSSIRCIQQPVTNSTSSSFGVELPTTTDGVRNWCIDRLRDRLRAEYATWLDGENNETDDHREQIDVVRNAA